MKKGVSVSNNQIFINRKSVLSLNEISLKGEKNLENVLASVAICSHFKVSCLNYSYAIKNFAPATHRMEMIGGVDGVTYVDDSKATNVASTLACVETFKDENIWLLLGGQGKDVDYAPIFNSDFVYKKVVCFGEESEKIAESAKKFKHDYIIFSHFNDAVKFCVNHSENGDFVLLSPACASFDEFANYAQRGERFKNLVLGQEYEE